MSCDGLSKSCEPTTRGTRRRLPLPSSTCVYRPGRRTAKRVDARYIAKYLDYRETAAAVYFGVCRPYTPGAYSVEGIKGFITPKIAMNFTSKGQDSSCDKQLNIYC